MPKYYAVRNGRETGVYSSWEECKAQTSRFSNAQFKSFNTEGEAQQYVDGSVGHQSSHTPGYYTSGPGLQYSEPYASSGHSSSGGHRLRIFTDGACPNNGFSGARGGIGVHFPDRPELDISEPLYGRQTNNRAEIEAASRALEIARANGSTKVEINTDSEFLYKAMTQWSQNWKQNNWKKSDGTDVVNKEDFQRAERVAQGMDIKWNKVPAHKGVAGNERADHLATRGVDNRYNRF